MSKYLGKTRHESNRVQYPRPILDRNPTWDDDEDRDGHPFAPESDAPTSRCGDCNRFEGNIEHAGWEVDYKYWPKDEDDLFLRN